ncbi:MAG: glycosyltransferase involved in cell wall biosynthesis [Gammaproteobacteria bacterium]|jgi:glycosyltransferase involved in cell wall biosynthesis
MAKIAIVLNASWNIYNFRLPLLKHLAEQGHEIIAIAPEDEYTAKIPYEFHPIKIKSRSLNPISHLAVFFRFLRIFRRTKPDIALLYTIHPNTYGNFAARLSGVKTISNIAGLGNLYITRGFATKVASALYKYALRHPFKVFFQNNEDMKMFIDRGLVDLDKSERIPGSGVDTVRFSPTKQNATEASHPFVFLLATRMLWEKGIAEFAQAARQIKQKRSDVIFRLIGPLDADNPSALSKIDLDAITADGAVEYAGVSDHMEDVIAASGCVVLPTYYREGLPKVLLEAASMAKPIITTDEVGCRDVVEHGFNGLLCEARNADDLAEQMLHMLELGDKSRQQMGINGRDKICREYAQEIIFRHYGKSIGLFFNRHAIASGVDIFPTN